MAYAYSGVYIEEDSSRVLNISSSVTAVPVFAHNAQLVTVEKGKVESVDSLLGFIDLIVDPKVVDIKEDKLYQSMAAYFACGGGRCYVCPRTLVDDEVPKFDDVALLVAAGENIRAELAALRTNGSSVFALLDSPYELSGNTVDMDSYDNSDFFGCLWPLVPQEGCGYANPGQRSRCRINCPHRQHPQCMEGSSQYRRVGRSGINSAFLQRSSWLVQWPCKTLEFVS